MNPRANVQAAATAQRGGGVTPAGDIVRRLVDNPLVTTAELEAQRERAEEMQASDRRADGRRIPAGKIEVSVNMALLIGGLSRVKGLDEAERLAAARYRALFEGAMIGGARALDYGAVRVDTSGPSAGAAFETGEDARRAYSMAAQRLGMVASRLVEQVVCHNMSLRAVARSAGEGEGAAARERVTERLLSAVDLLADHFGYTGSAPQRTPMRRDGERPAMAMPVEGLRKAG